MQIKPIKIYELSDFIKSELFKTSDVIPISSIRALSHSNNPRAQKDDIALIIAVSDTNQIIGYIGILSDRLYTGESAGWLSCWWVDDKEGKKIGMHLFLLAIKAWEHKFIITDFTPQIKGIIQKTKFFTFTPTHIGVRGFLRFNLHKIIPQKLNSLKYFKLLLIVADAFSNIFNNLRLSLSGYKKIKIESVVIDKFNTSDHEFISRHNSNEYIQRNTEELNWITQNPWVLSKDKADEKSIAESQKYYFSLLANDFKYHCLRLHSGDQQIGLIFLRQKDRDFTIPYIWFEESHLTDVANFIISFLIKNKANSFTVFHPILSKKISEMKTPFYYTRKIEKDFAVTNELKAILGTDKYLQDGDGDYVFT